MAKTLALLVMAVFLIGAHGCFAPASQVFGQIHYESNRPDNAIALTFDNSPMEPYTSEILDILAAYNVKATFFVSGENVARYPEVAKRIVAEGHILGNHSYNHDALGAFIEYGNEDLVMAQEIIQDITGILPILYRPPYGIKTPWHLKGIEDMGMIPITWSTSLDEFEELSLQEEVEKITSKIESGEIIRLYNGNEADNEAENACYYMLEALPLFIEQLLEEGYKLITVPELLDIPAYIDQPAK